MRKIAALLAGAFLLLAPAAFAQGTIGSNGISGGAPPGADPAAMLFNRPLDLGTGALTANGGINTTGAASLTGGGTLGGNFGGALSLTGSGTALILSGTAEAAFGNGFTFTALTGGPSGAGSFHADSNWGGILRGLSGAVADLALQDSGGAVQLKVINGTGIDIPNELTSGTLVSNTLQSGVSVTLSGSTVPPYAGYFFENWSGSSTVAGNTTLSNLWIGTSGDNANISSGTRNELLIGGIYGGTAFTGGRGGVMVQMEFSRASTFAHLSDGGVGLGAKIIATVNEGGIAGAPLGAFYGANPWTDCETGATYLAYCIGTEIDGALETGASASVFDLLQIVLTGDHATHGTASDVGLTISAQAGASAGLRNAITMGRYDSGGTGSTYSSPLDPNGYMFQVQPGAADVPDTTLLASAGGFDLSLASFGGSGAVGGGFAWRSPGVQLLPASAQIGYLGITAGANGAVLSSDYEKMTGTPTVATGGSNWTVGTLACDVYGDCVRVASETGGVVSAVNVVAQGWQVSPPANPVTFTGFPGDTGATPSGLTLNLTWTAANTITLGASGELVAFATGAVLKSTVVASLPTCDTAEEGTLYYVTDATSPTYNGTLTGGGSVVVPAFCNGSAWTAH